MSSPITIGSEDLVRWAVHRDAQEQLPELVRGLIHATLERDVVRSAFPSGESVQLGGWDGWAQTRASNAFVPEGLSV